MAKTVKQKSDYDFENNTWWYAKSEYNKDEDTWRLTDKLEIDLISFLDWLYLEGFRYAKINDNSVLFRIENHKILHEIEVSELTQFIIKTINSMPTEIPCSDKRGTISATIHKRMLLEKLLKGISFYTDKKKLDAYLGPKDYFTMQTDGPAEKYVYFKNGYLHINAKGIEFLPYQELNGFIWHSEIVQKDYKQPATKQAGVVEKFFNLVANGAEPDYTNKLLFDNPESVEAEKIRRATRFADLCNIAGYLAHGYTNYELKAIVLTDMRISESNEPNGRSGKSLFMKLVASIICADVTQPRQKTYVELDGKDFDQSKDFKFQQASHETKLMFLNDVKRNFKFEGFFNYITDGQDIEKKGKDSIRVKLKWAIATNLSIELNGESSKARACVFEFSDYFSATNSPQDVFGHWFFRDWDDEEYMRMYYFMAKCCQTFFADGCRLPKPEIINYSQRIVREHTSREFIEYMEDEWKPTPGQEYCLQDYYNKFLEHYPDWKKKNLLQQRFTEWVKKYIANSSKFKPYNKSDHYRRTSDGKTFIQFELK